MLLLTIETFVVSFLSLYIVVNPTAVSAVYHGLTRQMSRDQRHLIAWKATLTAFAILTFFALAGTFILAELKITNAALRIAGGVFLFALGFALSRGREHEFFGPFKESAVEGQASSVAYCPVAVPLMAGPASITVVMTSSTKAADDPYAWAALLAAIAATCLLSAFSMYRWVAISERQGSVFGAVLPRIMGLVLAVIAVQFIIDGVMDVVIRMVAVTS